ncbi:hypothetical protein PM082_018192 [Marasmius tenuissimus]|nr:hypothetical protein PM082_018192 [Marasmius tenuissimus]
MTLFIPKLREDDSDATYVRRICLYSTVATALYSTAFSLRAVSPSPLSMDEQCQTARSHRLSADTQWVVPVQRRTKVNVAGELALKL